MSAEIEEDEMTLSEEEAVTEEGHGEDENPSEHEDQIEPCLLSHEVIRQSLSLLCRTGNGLAHAFVKLDLKDR